MQLRAVKRASVASDGTEIVVPLTSKKLRADFAFETVPKLYPYVYHRLKVSNPFPFPLLAGEVELYRGNAYVGRSRLKLRAPNEPFSLSLGIDNQIQVKRYVKLEKREKASTFGSTQRLIHRYKIQVGNWTRKTKRIRVLENIPVSQVREIKVNLESGATKPTSWNKSDGILGWALKVGPRSKKVIDVRYVIEVPKSYVVHGYR
jgi:uncharacterized protein (TIGR02231 family)